jgi:hypothetical protein
MLGESMMPKIRKSVNVDGEERVYMQEISPEEMKRNAKSNELPSIIRQVVILIREVIDVDEIREMKRMAERGGITSLYFYPIRDEHYDEGFVSGELLLIDGETNEKLVHKLINLQKSCFGEK